MSSLIDALDLSVPAAKPLEVTNSPKSESEAVPAPRLDERRLQCRRSKLSKNRREAKARRFAPQVARQQQPATISSRLELRIHATPVDEEDGLTSLDAPGGGGGGGGLRKWSKKEKAKRRAMSMPPQRSSQFIVVDEEVGDTNTPVCGIDLGPFLSWLNCMPAIPEAKVEEASDEEEEETKKQSVATPSPAPSFCATRTSPSFFSSIQE